MHTNVTGRHVEIDPSLRDLIDTKLQRLERVLSESAVSVHVILSQARHLHTVEIVLHARGDHQLRGEASSDTWAQALHIAIDKVDQQAHTMKGKWDDRRRAPAAPPAAEPGGTPSP